MNGKKFRTAALVAITMLVSACSGDESEVVSGIVEEPENVESTVNVEPTVSVKPRVVVPKTRTDIELTAEGSRVNDAANQFSLNFFKTLFRQQDAGSNLIVSPFSAQAALAMTANGAKGKTQSEMLEAMNMKGLSLADINEYNQTIVKALTDLDNTSFVESANGIWVKKPILLLDSYVGSVERAYDANVKSIDFNAKDLAAINDWTKERTHGMIPSLFEEDETLDCAMLLANALYFNAVWKEPFMEGLIRKSTFRNADGSSANVDMMQAVNGNRNYWSGKTFDLCALPYGNEAFSMVFLLPHEDATLDESIDELAQQDWKKIGESMSTRQYVSLSVPKFELPATRYDLIPTLKSMGMQTPFIPSADFSGMTEDVTLCIDKVNQKAALTLNEQGTQAAAVTEVRMIVTGGDWTPTPIDFTLNRPFAFLIKEKSTGVILFAGAVNRLN